MINRRYFLIGAGALLTASFVRRASAFSKNTGRPLILPAVQEPEETLYVYWQADSEVANWRVSLRPDQPFAPPPPTWREHLRSLGHPLETDSEIERACGKYDLPVDDLDPALTASDGRTDGTTSPDPRPRRSTCSRASIWVTQDQRLGRPARSCWRCPRRQRMRARHYRRNPIVLANHDRTKPIATASVEARGEPSTPRSNLRSKAFPPRRTNLVASPRPACSEPVPSGSDRSNPSLSAVDSEARGFSRWSFWNLVCVVCLRSRLACHRKVAARQVRSRFERAQFRVITGPC